MGNIQFGGVVFFGRSLAEYVAMFDLDLASMNGLRVLDCPAGPASFAMQAAEQGITVVACDPLYDLDPLKLRETVDNDAAAVSEQQARNRHLLHQELIPTPVRRQSMELFLQDYETNKATGRYVTGSLPTLPFEDRSFDMVLSANFLFLYSGSDTGGLIRTSPFDYDFHVKAVFELLRVSRNELRLHPLQGPGGMKHPYLEPLMQSCIASGYEVSIHSVAQRDIIGAEQMLRISRSHD